MPRVNRRGGRKSAKSIEKKDSMKRFFGALPAKESHCSRNMPTKEPNFFIWTEDQAKKGSTEIAAALLTYLNSADLSGVEVLRLFADGCGGQNKNSHVVHMLIFWLKNHAPANVAKIVLTFLCEATAFCRQTGKVHNLAEHWNLYDFKQLETYYKKVENIRDAKRIIIERRSNLTESQNPNDSTNSIRSHTTPSRRPRRGRGRGRGRTQGFRGTNEGLDELNTVSLLKPSQNHPSLLRRVATGNQVKEQKKKDVDKILIKQFGEQWFVAPPDNKTSVMHWYGGSIAEAVKLSKQRNVIFVVFVEGENDLSAEMVKTLENVNIRNRLSDENNFLAIKLSDEDQFVPVPSLFFIGRNGTPLEVVCAGVDASSLATRIDRILEAHRKETTSLQPSTSGQNVKEQSQNLIQSESAPPNHGGKVELPEPEVIEIPETPTVQPATVQMPGTSSPPKVEQPQKESSPSQEYDIVCDGDVCIRKPRNNPEGAGPSRVNEKPAQSPQDVAPESNADTDAKMEKAKQLLEAKRREKLEKEKEEEKQKELERRELGQNVGALKRWQAEQELKQIQDERRREKQENDLARQRILEQIAQDRAERRARDTAASPAPPAQSASTPAPPTSGDVTRHARLQFKLPDGSSHTAQFSADDDMATVRQYVVDNLQLSSNQFSLWTAFPRRELTDANATLRNLELAPSAALLVLEQRARRAVAAAPDNRGFIAMIMGILTQFVFQPTQNAWNWLRDRLFGGGGAAAQRPRSESPQPPQQPPSAPGLRYRAPTNIRRLTGDRNPDDDNNTWNGNSTQQM
ncbi:UBX domain-containing protein 4 [Eumeta japonica]|uniref:UBX domain-containing protein 4 n=1 Tax=Eumeta variegata TaxID=151549 RepID=A0A4C1UTL5_EUMVA|nr:UBX domain-containing protein 4 [Eumeta japonica]